MLRRISKRDAEIRHSPGPLKLQLGPGGDAQIVKYRLLSTSAVREPLSKISGYTLPNFLIASCCQFGSCQTFISSHNTSRIYWLTVNSKVFNVVREADCNDPFWDCKSVLWASLRARWVNVCKDRAKIRALMVWQSCQSAYLEQNNERWQPGSILSED